MRLTLPRRSFMYGGIALMGFALASAAVATPAQPETWPVIKTDFFGDRVIEDGRHLLTLDTPVRAEDAALVPVSVRIPAAHAANVAKLTLIVDENPAPLVATFTYGPAAGTGDRFLSTRIRVNAYSNVRAIAETADGRLNMVANFVKAAGGCSAPASKDADAARAELGKMLIKTYAANPAAKDGPQAQLLIKHPSSSGFQMDQLTGLYVPAMYVEHAEVRRGKDLVFKMEGGISISENPNFRFSYDDATMEPLEVSITDTNGNTFSAKSALTTLGEAGGL